MTELALTPARRDELSELLRDAERLRAEYPKVAEYWEMAPSLPGTDDPHADSAFDLRFINYMTGGEAESGNPYWDIVGPSVFSTDGRRVVNGGQSEGSARLAFVQTILQDVYAYAIPSPETVDWISRFCEARALTEVGAGRGYWAAQLTLAGLTVAAYDSEPPGRTDNVSFPRRPGQVDTWCNVGNMEDLTGRGGVGADEVLLLCWPPGWGNTMASEALTAFERSGGTRLVFVGEPKGGMTADNAFFDALSRSWELVSEDANHVSWWNLNDVAQGWIRR